MSVIATAVRHLMAAGVTGEDLIAAIADMEQAQPKDAAAERRRAWDRERKRKAKADRSGGIPVESAENAESNTLDKKDPHTPKKINPKSPPIVPPFSEKFVDAWNGAAKRSGLTSAMPLTAERKAKLKRRVAEFGEDALLTAIAKLAESPFHCGENDRAWRADIGWLLRSSENVAKALELSDRPPRNPAPPASNDFLDHVLAKQSRMTGARQ